MGVSKLIILALIAR